MVQKSIMAIYCCKFKKTFDLKPTFVNYNKAIRKQKKYYSLITHHNRHIHIKFLFACYFCPKAKYKMYIKV